jgi:hypothetical protein
MNRVESWAKARKAMTHWKLPNDFGTVIEKGLNGYTRDPNGGAVTAPFPPTYNNRSNHIKFAFGEQDRIG